MTSAYKHLPSFPEIQARVCPARAAIIFLCFLIDLLTSHYKSIAVSDDTAWPTTYFNKGREAKYMQFSVFFKL